MLPSKDQTAISRRALIGGATVLLLSTPLRTLASVRQVGPTSFRGEEKFRQILAKAKERQWAALQIGERVGKVALELLNTPYVGHTLELDDTTEYCTINLEGLDCVTFFEDALDIARILRLPNPSMEDFLAQVRYTRYRGGVQGDYTSRLHYTSDWIFDNSKRGVVADLSPHLPGAVRFTQKVGFMSRSPASYRQLRANPGLVPKIRALEEAINLREMWFVPMESVGDAEQVLHTGDIIGITTSTEGIDVVHTGLCYTDKFDGAHFLDASSAPSRMKVTLEGRLSGAIRWSKTNTGLMAARPLERRLT